MGNSNVCRDEEYSVPQGTVRWFDADRGFGFIDLGNEAEDLFVHASEIDGDDGQRLLREGRPSSSRWGGRPWPAGAPRPCHGRPGRRRALGRARHRHLVRAAKGYGFVTPDHDRVEIFVHSSAIVGAV
ncbi:cold shock domain-containing protein [Oerskovia sp. M15]